MKYCNRPGLNEQEQKWLKEGTDFKPCEKSVVMMGDYIIANLNAMVQPNDTLRILGDFIFAPKRFYRQWATDFRARINCKNVHLVAGNHDKIRNGELDGLFESISLLKDIVIEKHYLVMCHYPMLSWNRSSHGSIMLHGHCHGNMEQWKRQHVPNALLIDVGIDCHNYKPLCLEDVLKICAERKLKHQG
jgi:calcineurin-like phosphoesterase family protein